MKPREKYVSHPRCIGRDRCARYAIRAPLPDIEIARAQGTNAGFTLQCAHIGYFGECRREKGPEGKGTSHAN